MKRLYIIIGLIVLSVSVFAVTYPSKPYRSTGRIHQSSDAILQTNGSFNKSVGGSDNKAVANVDIALSPFVSQLHGGNYEATVSSEPKQFATTTLDGNYSLRRGGPPSTEDDDPNNPALWQPIADAPLFVVLMAMIYSAYIIIRRKYQRSSDCQ